MEEPIRISLSKLSADIYGKRVAVDVLISGQSNPKNIPRYLRFNPKNGDLLNIELNKEENYTHLRNVLFFPRNIKKDLSAATGFEGKYDYDETRCDYYILLCRDILGEEKFDETVYHSIPVHLIGQQLPNTKRVRLEGRVVDDSNRNLTILAYSVRPIEEKHNIQFSASDHESFKRYFRNHTNLKEDIERSIEPRIVGRPKAKLAAALTLCSPLAFYFEGELVRGSLHTMFLGDTTTGKSRILEWIRDVLKLGEYGVGDMSTYAGLLAAVDTDKDIIIWGLLPMADRELALIDSFQKIHPEDVPMFREALRDQRLIVRKKVSGEAACRARVLAAANPNKVLDAYIDSSEAFTDLRYLTDPVDLTRWDLFIRFHGKDVPDNEIAESRATPPKIPTDVIRKFVLWAWSLRPEQIKITPEAEKAIKEAFLSFSGLYYSDLPLIHKGFKETIARIAVAIGVLRYSISPHDTSSPPPPAGDNYAENTPRNSLNTPAGKLVTFGISILPEHVEEATRFLREVLEAWEFESFVTRMRGMGSLKESEIEEIAKRLQEDLMNKQIFEEVARRQGTGAIELASKLNVARETIIRNAADLKAMELIESKERRKGYWLTKKGVAYFRSLRGSELSQEEKVRRIFEIIESLEKEHIDCIAETSRVVKKAKEVGLAESCVNEIVRQELQRGHLFEPKPAWIQRTVR